MSTDETNQSALGSLREELPGVWRTIPDKGIFFALLAAWLALFHLVGNPTFGYSLKTSSLLGWMYGIYTLPNSEDGHGLLIPWVVLALLWWKRGELQAVPKRIWLPGLGLLAGCVVLHMAAYLIQQPRISVLALLGGFWVLMATVWGWRLGLATLFPMALLIFCLPVGTLADELTVPLRQISTTLAVRISHGLLGIPVIQTGVQILDPQGRYQYEVAAACSGIRSLVTLFALTTIYGFITFRSAWKRALMVGVAVPLALLGNVIRLLGIIVAAEAFGHRAGEIAHDWFGFVTFGVALAVILGLGYWLREGEEPVPPVAGGRTP